MGQVRVASFSVSLDGFGAGVEQSLDHPLGKGGMGLHNWFFETRVWRAMQGMEGGDTGVDNDFAQKGFENTGAWILGRNMFGPVRGPWLDDAWNGWWGDNPPYHTPVFVLTHYAREPLLMNGGTTFYFVTEGIERAIEFARKAAGGRDVRIGGGVATIRQGLEARYIDGLHLVYSPVFLGAGESLLQGIDLNALGYSMRRHTQTERCLHVEIEKE